MTDNHTPVEFSWDWGCANDEPTVRYSIEPIGCNAGTPKDPLNEHAAARMLWGLRSLFLLVTFARSSACLGWHMLTLWMIGVPMLQITA